MAMLHSAAHTQCQRPQILVPSAYHPVQPYRAARIDTSFGCTCSNSRAAPLRLQRAAAGSSSNGNSASTSTSKSAFDTVSDVMTTGRMFTCRPEDTVDSALEMLVTNRITGLPVVDESNHVVGVVSDFDLLALDTLGRTNTEELFPATDQTWQVFKEVKSMLAKSAGKKIKDVMTKLPITVRADTNLNDATRLLLSRKIRRLPVVDSDGCLVGMLSRGNIIKAALASRQSVMAERN